jgi:hypothetical protein
MTNDQIITLIIDSLIIAFSLAAIVFAFGVVWRTERELDISYKLFLGAIIAFTVAQFLELFSFEGRTIILFLILAAKLIFAALFLAGTLTARDLLRKMDGEKEDRNINTNTNTKISE